MPKFYTLVIFLINQSKEACEKQFTVFGSKGGQISPLMHVPQILVYKATVVPTKSDSDIIFCLQLLSQIQTCTPHLR